MPGRLTYRQFRKMGISDQGYHQWFRVRTLRAFLSENPRVGSALYGAVNIATALLAVGLFASIVIYKTFPLFSLAALALLVGGLTFVEMSYREWLADNDTREFEA